MKRRTLALALGFVISFLLIGQVKAKNEALSLYPKSVIAGEHCSAVIMSDDSLYIWGKIYDQLISTPIKVMENVRSVTLNSTRIEVITNDNTLWYVETKSLLSETELNPPEKIRDNVLSYTKLFCSYITTDLELRCNDHGAENHFASDVISAIVLPRGFSGSGYAIVHSDGSLWMSGSGAFYGDGYGPHENYTSVSSFHHIMDDVLSVHGSTSTVAVIKTDHSLWIWGYNGSGQIGNGSIDNTSLVPVKVMDDVLSVDWGEGQFAGEQTWGALRSDGSLWMWGSNLYYQIGNGEGGTVNGSRAFSSASEIVRQTVPVKVLDDVVDFSVGQVCTLAIKSDGSLWGWGSNGYNQLGDDGTGNLFPDEWNAFQTVPIKIMDGVRVTDPRHNSNADVSVAVFGNTLVWTDAVPFIDENSRTMVPLRAVAEALGLTVRWNSANREAVFTDGTKTIYFPIGSNTAHTETGDIVQMDTAAIIVKDRTFAPIRYLAEYFDYVVDWDGTTKTVIIQ